MKQALTVSLAIFCFVLGASAQQPHRRGLDSLDLLASSPSRSAAAPSILVDLETFKLLGPLIEYAREFDAEYREKIIDNRPQPSSAAVMGRANQRAAVIYRSMMLLLAMDNTPAAIRELIRADQELVADIGRVAALAADGDTTRFPKEINALKERFGIAGPGTRQDGSVITDRELLVAAMLQRLTSDLARIKVA